MKENTIKDKAEMFYSLKFENEAGIEQNYKFWFFHLGDNYWNMNWSVFIENKENENDWEYHDLSGWILRNEFNAAHPYEWIISFAHRRWQNSTAYVVKKIY